MNFEPIKNRYVKQIILTVLFVTYSYGKTIGYHGMLVTLAT